LANSSIKGMHRVEEYLPRSPAFSSIYGRSDVI